MSEFKVNDRVRIKPNATFSYPFVQAAFANADMHGVIENICDGTYNPTPITVITPDGLQWDSFARYELERIEDQ